MSVLERHRPTLPELVSRRGGARAVKALAALAVLGGLLLAFAVLRPEDDGVDVVRREGPVQFNLRHPPALSRVTPVPGEYLRLERRGEAGRFVQSFAVSEYVLPAYRGEVGGLLPVEAAREIEALRRRFPGFTLVQDGKTRVNEVSGYQILFRVGRGPERRYGRQILLPQDVPGTRRGVRLTLLASLAAGVSNAREVGVRGVIKAPYRTFRFGTEKP